jgi:hypothetical protein
MRRVILAVSLLCAASAALASDAIFRLSGWAEISSTYRHPGPVSGQFSGPANGVTPPYQGQPIPGFSGMIPSTIAGSFIALLDNGYGAQGNSADFLLGFYDVTPMFKTSGDGTTCGAVQGRQHRRAQRTRRVARRPGLPLTHHPETGHRRNYLSEAVGKLGGRNQVDAARIARVKGWL